MPTEKSYLDRAQRSGELHAAVSTMAPPYAPADSQFTLTALGGSITAAGNATSAVDAARPPWQDQVSDRAALVKTLGPLVTQALAYVKSNTAWANRCDAVKDLADKVRGVTPPKAKPAEPEPDKKARNSGEHSYVEIASHLKRFIARLQGLPGYDPQDPKIGIPALEAKHATLDSLNQSLPALAQTLADAIADRQQAYTSATGLKFVFDGVKNSVKAQYGQSSPAYQSISGMRW